MEYIVDIILCIVIVVISFILIYRNILAGTPTNESPYPKLSSEHPSNKKIIGQSKNSESSDKPKSNKLTNQPKNNKLLDQPKNDIPKSILKKPIDIKSTDKKSIKKRTNVVFIDISESNKYIGKIIIKLFTNITPKTCNNFYYLCKKGLYKSSPLHRIIKDFMIQGGDFTNGDGTGGRSIYGDKFTDENFDIPHDKPYLLSMANSGPNTNGSQFFITTNEASHLDGKHVVFGEVIDGHDIVDYLNDVETCTGDKPCKKIIISDCGLYQ